MLTRYLSREEKVWTSVLRPERPTISLSCMGNIFLESVDSVCACTPNRRSEAIPTQFLPVIATRAVPLYDMMDMAAGLTGQAPCNYTTCFSVTQLAQFFVEVSYLILCANISTCGARRCRYAGEAVCCARRHRRRRESSRGMRRRSSGARRGGGGERRMERGTAHQLVARPHDSA